MKRSVAVLGATPQFIRWSIDHPCKLRVGGDTASPDATFRQLRGVREFSCALSEDRVFESVCIHGSAVSSDPDNAMGFTEAEVLEVFGGREQIDNCCNRCQANTNAYDASEPLWAGCYGWLSADGTSISYSPSSTSEPVESTDETIPAKDDLLVKEIDFAIQMLNLQPLIENNFSSSKPAWFSFWQESSLTVPQLLLLEKVLSTVLRRHESAGNPEFVDDLLRFIDALTLCHRHSMRLNVELVPRGWSDGRTWTTFAHCQKCRYSVSSTERSWRFCPACGLESPPSGERKSKVLGLRPYVNLHRALGHEQTLELLTRYEQSNGASAGRDS